MKSLLGAALAAALAGGTPPLCAREMRAATTAKSPAATIQTETMTGTVLDYEPGRSIKIESARDLMHAFDLDPGAKIEGTITIGQPARVHFVRTIDGAEHVTAVSEASTSASR